MEVKYEFDKGFFENFLENPSFHNSRPPQSLKTNPEVKIKKTVPELHIIASRTPRSFDINDLFKIERKTLTDTLQKFRKIDAQYEKFYERTEDYSKRDLCTQEKTSLQKCWKEKGIMSCRDMQHSLQNCFRSV